MLVHSYARACRGTSPRAFENGHNWICRCGASAPLADLDWQAERPPYNSPSRR
jgi:hypothetical protein